MASFRSLMNSTRTLLILGGVGVIGLAIAVPTCIGAFTEDDPHEHPVDPEPYVPPPTAAAVAASESDPTHDGAKAEEVEEAPATPVLETSADGDVEASIKFRFAEVESGERGRATIQTPKN